MTEIAATNNAATQASSDDESGQSKSVPLDDYVDQKADAGAESAQMELVDDGDAEEDESLVRYAMPDETPLLGVVLAVDPEAQAARIGFGHGGRGRGPSR